MPSRIWQAWETHFQSVRVVDQSSTWSRSRQHKKQMWYTLELLMGYSAHFQHRILRSKNWVRTENGYSIIYAKTTAPPLQVAPALLPPSTSPGASTEKKANLVPPMSLAPPAPTAPVAPKLKRLAPGLKYSSSDSAITRHLKESPKCLMNVCADTLHCFSVLARARNSSHLAVLEALFIASRKPVLCVQKEYVRTLLLF